MTLAKLAAAALAALTIGATAAPAAVEVTFVGPERFHDSDFRSASKRSQLVSDLTRYLERLDRRYFGKDVRIEIDVLDARLAGRYEPWRRSLGDVRILRDTTPPRFTMRYTMRQKGKVVLRGEEVVTDLAYLRNAFGMSGSLAYEKAMLRDWFRKRFVELKPPPGPRR